MNKYSNNKVNKIVNSGMYCNNIVTQRIAARNDLWRTCKSGGFEMHVVNNHVIDVRFAGSKSRVNPCSIDGRTQEMYSLRGRTYNQIMNKYSRNELFFVPESAGD